ncbi:MAG: FAD-dependent monooxygenase [Nitratireductor sp.]|nr:FAD-dependent monooxygenase [Nitratireductor sp.]
MAPYSRTILIAGGGITGLTAALCLSRAGFRVDIFERAEGFETVGAGLQISPNALCVLAMLGLERAVKNVAVAPAAIRMISAFSGKPIASVPLGAAAIERYGLPYLVVHRADLQQVLASAVRDDPDISLHLDARVEDAVTHANGVTALVGQKGRNSEFTGRVLVAADGVHSVIRKLAFSGHDAFHTGFAAWRGLISSDALSGAQDRETTRLWLAPDAHAVAYPVRHGRYVNVVGIVKTKPDSEAAEVRSTREMMSSFEGWNAEFNALINHKIRWTLWPLWQVPAMPQWHRGNLVLAGDAAHAISPFAAQGAAMGIEDAAVLAHHLGRTLNIQDEAGGAVGEALAQYSRERMARVARVRRLTAVNRVIYHLPKPVAVFRDLGMKVLGGRRLLKRQDWLYQWRAEEFRRNLN